MNPSRFLLSAAVACSFFTLVQSACAQGSLTPPGAPAPTMKTLDQLGTNVLQVSNLVAQVTNRLAVLSGIEPRFAITAFGINLTVPGSYYLTNNLFSGASPNDGINVFTNNVTIDLNGFSIISTNPAGTDSPAGVRINGSTNVTIRNGQFSGFDRAVRAQNTFYGVLVENVQTANCRRAGIEGAGIAGDASQTFTVRNCVVNGVDATGEGSNVPAAGISLVNCTGVVDSCVVRDIVGFGTGTGVCVFASGCTNTFINNNFLSHAAIGLQASGSASSVFYRNNLTAGCGTSFAVSGGVDRGGNF